MKSVIKHLVAHVFVFFVIYTYSVLWGFPHPGNIVVEKKFQKCILLSIFLTLGYSFQTFFAPFNTFPQFLHLAYLYLILTVLSFQTYPFSYTFTILYSVWNVILSREDINTVMVCTLHSWVFFLLLFCKLIFFLSLLHFLFYSFATLISIFLFYFNIFTLYFIFFFSSASFTYHLPSQALLVPRGLLKSDTKICFFYYFFFPKKIY